MKPQERLKKTKRKMFDQLKNYKLLRNSLTNPFGKAQETVSGKTNESGKITPGINDDLMFCLTGLCHMLNLFLQRSLPGIRHYDSYLGLNNTMVK
jgi:hypothetical protein